MALFGYGAGLSEQLHNYRFHCFCPSGISFLVWMRPVRNEIAFHSAAVEEGRANISVVYHSVFIANIGDEFIDLHVLLPCGITIVAATRKNPQHQDFRVRQLDP